MGEARRIPIEWKRARAVVGGLFRDDGTLTGLDVVQLPATRPPHASGEIKLLLDAIWILEGMLADRLDGPKPWDLEDLERAQQESAFDGPLRAVVGALAKAQAAARNAAAVDEFLNPTTQGEPA
tara:strand:+ start:448 stop:819 length:372 start_codon:yes stop_codon:yes gene_type:complete